MIWFAVKFISYKNPTRILRKSYDNAAICIVRSNWRRFWLWNAYLNLAALGHLKTDQITPVLTEAASPYKHPTTILRKSYDKNTSFALLFWTRLWELSPVAGNQLPDNKPVIPTQQLRRTQQRLRLHPKCWLSHADNFPTTILQKSYGNPTTLRLF